MPLTLPAPEIFMPESGEPSLRWGVVGRGWIAGEFVRALQRHTAQQVVAVATRSREGAAEFAAAHGIDQSFDSVDALVSSRDVDVVYVATPTSEHVAIGLRAIAAGKHVMIEKPLAPSADDARILVDAARSAGVLVMEAMWSRYLPQTSIARQLLADGMLGEVHAVIADHGQVIPRTREHRLFRPELSGGALLDLGIYPLQLASMVLGTPTGVHAVGRMTDTGVDAQSTLVLTHQRGAEATVFSSLISRTRHTATIAGADATIELGPSFYVPSRLSLVEAHRGGASVDWIDDTGLTLFAGLSYEATALATFVGEGRIESPLHTLDETVSILATIDEAVAQIASSDRALVEVVA